MDFRRNPETDKASWPAPCKFGIEGLCKYSSMPITRACRVDDLLKNNTISPRSVRSDTWIKKDNTDVPTVCCGSLVNERNVRFVVYTT